MMKYFSLLIVCMISICHAQDVDPNKKLQELGIQLTELKSPVANYVKAVQTGKLLFISGHIPDEVVGKKTRGKVGTQLTIEEGNEAAKRR